MKSGQRFLDHNGRKLTIIRVDTVNVEYIRHGEQVTRVCPIEWFEAENYRAVKA
jgi:Domain of unknown function (DUF4222)